MILVVLRVTQGFVSSTGIMYKTKNTMIRLLVTVTLTQALIHLLWEQQIIPECIRITLMPMKLEIKVP
ncbi:unnamed protein product [Callosobruchus maculatus]|uniref:Uncharacterized protein n=1 Tax=Callosobruchus maculatus TaxID=64391 RepID=A0A653DS31_CALMS|nr:unnamed protein product [Callosobruchus maculatus]